MSGPAGVVSGLPKILLARDTLITDYIEIGGIGAACVNAGLLTFVTVAIYRLSGAAIGGGAMAAMLLVLGFGLFGKNLLNVWPIIGGVWFYSRYKGDHSQNTSTPRSSAARLHRSFRRSCSVRP